MIDDLRRTNVRREMKDLVKRTGFKNQQYAKQIEDILVRAIRVSRLYRRPLPKDIFVPELNRWIPYRKPKRGRQDQKRHRYILLSAICRSWLLGFNEQPIVNKRGNDSTPFVAFVEDIFMGEGIANTIDNIDDYRTHKKKLYREFEK
jgi:hypothetical protein